MTYQEAVDFLYNQLASYQHQGHKAFNKSLDKTFELLQYVGNPQYDFKTIHVAGTNGKGSSCHMISSILQEAGCKTGLYTSPHLKDFTERIKINGEEVEQKFVVDFVENNADIIKKLKPSFFEMTTVMAFLYFLKNNVDYAVIETGLGGRLDSTNVISPEVCLITNIGFDHQGILGNTLIDIAREKAGIIKENTPVVIGSSQSHELNELFKKEAENKNAPISIINSFNQNYEIGLKGIYQHKNVPGVLQVIKLLSKNITENEIKRGLKNIVQNTGLKGRWQTLNNNPLTVCDTGHNVDGVKEIVNQINRVDYDHLYIVLGMVSDKDYQAILKLLPLQATYLFVQAKNERSLPALQLLEEAEKLGMKGETYPGVNEAISVATKKASEKDLIFIGGSTFVVADIEDI